MPNNDELTNLPKAAMTELLACALEGEESPFDRLAARLTRQDGSQWLQAQWSIEMFEGLNAEDWPAEAPSKEDIAELKKRSKRAIRDDDAEQQLAGTLGYVIANVMSLANYGEKISNLDAETLATQLRDFVEVLEAPWGDCVAAAVKVLSSS